MVDVAEENARLRVEIKRLNSQSILASEEKAELLRLRALLQLEALHSRPAFGARVIAMRLGPLAVLQSFSVNKGFLNGAVVGTPVVTEAGVVGRVHRTSPHAATVLMVTDPGFRLAVISQATRTPGIVSGAQDAGGNYLEMAYVPQNSRLTVGELLVTSGVDGSFPKGIPVGTVTKITPAGETLFLQVRVAPAAHLDNLEEVLLLREDGTALSLLPPLPDTFNSAATPAETAAPSPVPTVSPAGPAEQARQ